MKLYGYWRSSSAWRVRTALAWKGLQYTYVPVHLAQNLARAIAEIRDTGATVIGLDGDAPERLEELALPTPVALVLGAEGKGLRQLTRESCDRLVRISTDGPLASLNVSNAAAVALHWAASRRMGLTGR